MYNNKFSKFFFWLFTVLIFSLMVSFTFNQTVSPYLSRSSNFFVSKVDYIISRPFLVVKDCIDQSQNLFKAYSENKKLKRKLKESDSFSSELKFYKSENKKLKELLKVTSPIQKSIIGHLMVRTPRSWADSIIVSYPSSSFINENTLVTSNDSLIGKVSDSRGNSSRIDLLTSGKNFDLPIKIEDKQGTIYGNLKSYHSDRQLMESSEFNSDQMVTIGAKVFTSGLDGETATDISIGTVAKIENSEDKLKRKIYIHLDGKFDDISYVYMIGKE